ncbi:MAG: LysE family transporter [Chloroflexi bacterium]|nr:LysE family transporter [Chloroflexota bacterium]
MPELSIPLILGTSFVVGLSGAMMPGPLLAVTAGETLRHGARVAVWMVLGHALMDLAAVLGLVGGLAGLATLPGMRGGVGLVGGAFLIWFGWLTVRAGWRGDLQVEVTPTARRLPVVVGAVVSLLNPGWLIWWATIGASYVVWAMALGRLGVVSFYGAHILADFAWYGTVAVLLVTGRRFFSGPVHRSLVLACGAFLLILGAMFLSMAAGEIVGTQGNS